MKLNTIYLCFLLWSLVGIMSMVVSAIRRYRSKGIHELKKIYLMQFLFLAEKGKKSEDIIKELYYSFINKKSIRCILLKAMRVPSAKSLDYIYMKIGCEPMKIIHGFIMKREAQNNEDSLSIIPKDIIQYFYELIEQWEDEYQETYCTLKKRKFKAFIEVVLLMCLNYMLYIKLKTDISLLIFVIVNTLGVILYIVLDNECYVVDVKSDERKLAGSKRIKNKTHAPARGLQNLYQLVSGMGLIINIFIIVAGWLGPIA